MSLVCSSILKAAHMFRKHLCALENPEAESTGVYGDVSVVGDPTSLAQLLANTLKTRLPKDCTLHQKNGFLNFHIQQQQGNVSKVGSTAAAVKRKKNETDASFSSSSSNNNNSSNNSNNSSSLPALTIQPIGIFRSCFKEKYGTPRQGSIAADAR